MKTISKKYRTVAIAYDFDGTLAPGNMQEHTFIPSLGLDERTFWTKVKKKAEKHDMDEILAYMRLSLQEAEKNEVRITKKDFEAHGKGIPLFDGVENYFKRINSYGKKRGLKVEHYIISSGLREFISGTKIANQFKRIYASGYKYNVNGVAIWPALAINYTNKTQYLFRINKGINNAFDNTRINQYMPEDERPVPFRQMIYIGDGETDVPTMKMIKYQGGTAIAVYNPKIKAKKSKPSPKQVCEALIQQNRADYIAPADYVKGGRLDKIIKLVINRIHSEIELKKYTE